MPLECLECPLMRSPIKSLELERLKRRSKIALAKSTVLVVIRASELINEKKFVR